jgi:hypothetical protein
MALHIVQGGVENGDKRWLERSARRGRGNAQDWVVPKSVVVGDEVIIYIGGYGFFATARITAAPKRRKGWKNRYGAEIALVRLIRPPISLGVLRLSVPKLTWAIYPRSITTPASAVASQVRELIRNRRKFRGMELDERALENANLDELRRVAVSKSRLIVGTRRRSVITRMRAIAIKNYVLRRAAGKCEFCEAAAPFRTVDGEPYLESHHITRLADEGPDHPAHVIGVCPNCHRRAHFSDAVARIRVQMKKRVAAIERRM